MSRKGEPLKSERVVPRSASPAVRELSIVIDQSHMTLVELARKSGVSHTAIWAWRTGRAAPRVVELEFVAQALGYEITLHKRAET